MDHAPLRWLSTAKIDNAQIMQWALALQPYKFCIVHQSGTDNITANFLSRCDKTSSDSIDEQEQETKLNGTGRMTTSLNRPPQGSLRGSYVTGRDKVGRP